MYQRLLKSLNRLNPRAWDFIQLTRMDKPIGIYLLLWPTLWALWIAGKGSPSLINILIFVLGVVLTRAGGCVINDWADRKVDGHVKRTEQRPLVSGKISSKEALVFFALLMGISFLLVLLTNATTILLSLGGLALAASYPFMKRYTYYPQVVLGAAFSWGMPMAFTAETGNLPAAAWLLYIANVLWTVGYDTYYAMTDRDDDLKIGVKSTAILFGDADRAIILTLQGLALACLLLAGARFELGGWFHLGLLAAAGCFAWEFWYTRDRDRMKCFKAFCTTTGPGWRSLSGLSRITGFDEGPGPSSRGPNSRLGDFPGPVHLAFTGHVAGLLVHDEGVERLAAVGPLTLLVVTGDHGPFAHGLVGGRRRQWRPVGGALIVAHGFAIGVLGEGIERHAVVIDQHPVFGRRRVRRECQGRQRQRRRDQQGLPGKSTVSHRNLPFVVVRIRTQSVVHAGGNCASS